VGIEGLALLSAGILGVTLGSFLNVCILRLPHDSPKDRSLLYPPSSCPRCKHPIEWRDNVPIVSWLVLRGKCRWCKAPISRQYPIIEALVGLLWVGAVAAYGFSIHALAAGLLGTDLLGIAIIDWRHKIIPDELSYGGLVVGLVLSLAGGAAGFAQAVLGAAVGWALLWVVRTVGGWVFKQEAMGWGDIKMMAMVGAFEGWKNVLLTVFVGALAGSIVYVPLLLGDLRSRRRREIPFGVFLAVGAAITFVAGDSIISWYLQFLHSN
jgi:leader peptidase (prepilin peptidase) / N-methyltransferase